MNPTLEFDGSTHKSDQALLIDRCFNPQLYNTLLGLSQ